MDLLKTNRLIEALTVEGMEAKEKRRFMNKKLVELGAKVCEDVIFLVLGTCSHAFVCFGGMQPLSRPKMPHKMVMRVKVNRTKKAEKEIQKVYVSYFYCTALLLLILLNNAIHPLLFHAGKGPWSLS